MTKQVRIENADTSNHKVRVRMQQKVGEEWLDMPGAAVSLDFPTSMMTAGIWKERRLVVEEYE